MRGGRNAQRRLIGILGPVLVAALITALAAAGLSAGVFASFRRQATDALFPSTTLNNDVVVVGIDSRSLQQVGKRWPWSRDVHAQLIRNLGAAGAKLVVYDVLFAESTDADADLAAALKAAPVVLAEVGTEPHTAGSGPSQVRDLATPAGPLADSAADVAHANVNADPADGVVRTVPLVLEDAQHRFVPAMSLDAYRILEHQPADIVVRPKGVQIGDRLVPADGHAGLRVNYPSGLGTSRSYLSAIDVIQNSFDATRVRGKTVFVGAADLGLGDNRLVPVNKGDGVPGVFVHASALHTMLTGTYLHELPRWETLLWILVMAYVVALVARLSRLLIAAIVSIAIGVGWLLLTFNRFDAGAIYDIIYPLLSVAGAFVVGVVLRYLTEGRRRRRVTTLFSQYIPGAVADQLCNDDRLDDAIAGQRVEATILFCDLRGFTAMSEKLAATDVRAVCEVYYEELTNVVYRHGGTLMSYLGDAVFAVFGAPLPQDDHAAAGLRAALEMRDNATVIKRQLEDKDLPWLSYGIGVNTGEVVAACVGGTHRRQYTVLGDAVNISSRLCSIAGAAEIILSDATRAGVPEAELPALEPIGDVTLKNVSRDLVLWRVAAETEAPAAVVSAEGSSR